MLAGVLLAFMLCKENYEENKGFMATPLQKGYGAVSESGAGNVGADVARKGVFSGTGYTLGSGYVPGAAPGANIPRQAAPQHPGTDSLAQDTDGPPAPQARRIAVAGRGGVGVSTVINALRGVPETALGAAR